MAPGPSTARRQWRLIELVEWGERYFSSKGFENPRRNIEWLLTDLLSVSRLELYLEFDSTVDPDQLTILRRWVKRRLKGEPLPYITGKTEFYGLPLFVNPQVLIPRPETERLVETAVELATKIDATNIVDVGTGSGCIAVALASQLENSRVLAIDVSGAALELASKNAKLNGVEKRVEFLKKDIRSESIPGTFDILASNPPYIRKNEMGKLMKEVREFEPINALTDGSDGLEFYRCFAASGGQYVRPGGFLVMEVGLGRHPFEVEKLFEKRGFDNVQLHQDYNGDNRVITVEVSP